MKNNEFKMLHLIITIIVALGILLGGYNLWQKYVVEKPLTERLLRMAEVNKAEVNKVNKLYSVQVCLDRVDDLQKSYADIDSIIDGSIKGDYAIEIRDGRNRKLGNFFDDLQPALYQGLAQKEFLWLAEQLEQKSRSRNIKSQLRVDNQRVYLQLEDGGAYLYSIIEHTPTAEQVPGRGRDN